MEISGHNFIIIKSNPVDDWCETYDTYRCINCGFYLFYYKINNSFWYHLNGEKYSRPNPNGSFIKLIDDKISAISCNEKIIKDLLE